MRELLKSGRGGSSSSFYFKCPTPTLGVWQRQIVTHREPFEESLMEKKLILAFFCTVIFLIGLLENPAYAYIDPGSGSYLFQIMLASLVGAVYAVKTYWVKIKEIARKFFHKDAS
jgi:hypothetical protein